MTATMEADRSTEGMSEAVATAGHNNPPEPTPFEKISEEIETLYGEARLWLDGEPVATQGQADGIAKLLNMIRDAAKRADLLRVAENKPFDDGKAEVQRRYAALIADTKGMKGKTTIATDACKKALAPWLDKLDREMKAEAERLRLAAEEKARVAQEAIRATAGDNIAEREAAESRDDGEQGGEGHGEGVRRCRQGRVAADQLRPGDGRPDIGRTAFLAGQSAGVSHLPHVACRAGGAPRQA
jgi:hypothetical protein